MGKVAGQRVTFRASARTGAIAASLAAAAALLLPITALAATAPIGSLLSPGQIAFTCPSGIDSVQSMSVGASYAIPPGGTSITQWSIQAGALDSGSVSLEVWSPITTGPNLYQLVAISDPQPITSDTLNTFDVPSTKPITVTSGDLLGLHAEGGVTCFDFTTNGPVDQIQYAIGSTPVVGGSETLDLLGQSVQLNVLATVQVTTTSNNVPTAANQCKGGGWQKLTDAAGTSFKNQGDCVSFVATGGTNLAAG